MTILKEVIGTATLYLGDCREIMPGLPPHDVLITDPVWPNAPRDSVPGSNDPWGLWSAAVGSMPDHHRGVIVMRSDSDPLFLSAYSRLPFFRIIHLPYVMPGYLGRALGGDEYAYWFGSVIRSAPGRRVVPGRAPAAQPSARPANGHPMSRAQAHFDWLVDWCCDEAETVFDPFMGSGTTLVAACRLGLRVTGIEIEPRYFDIACRRVEAAQRQGDMFVSAHPPVPTDKGASTAGLFAASDTAP